MKRSVCILTLAFLVVVPYATVTAQSNQDLDLGSARFRDQIERELDDQIGDLVKLSMNPDYDPEYLRTPMSAEGSWPPIPGTSTHNPLLTAECHNKAIDVAIDEMMRRKSLDKAGAVEMGTKHMADRRTFANSSHTYAEYIQHVSECKAWCGPVVKSLLACHIEVVAENPHEIVLFPTDSYAVSPKERLAISRVSQQLARDAERKVLLIGRASKTGTALYNRDLSKARTDSVFAELLAEAVPDHRIQRMYFGYDPPQITGTIAGAYGYRGLYQTMGNLRMNQSVILVVY